MKNSKKRSPLIRNYNIEKDESGKEIYISNKSGEVIYTNENETLNNVHNTKKRSPLIRNYNIEKDESGKEVYISKESGEVIYTNENERLNNLDNTKKISPLIYVNKGKEETNFSSKEESINNEANIPIIDNDKINLQKSKNSSTSNLEDISKNDLKNSNSNIDISNCEDRNYLINKRNVDISDECDLINKKSNEIFDNIKSILKSTKENTIDKIKKSNPYGYLLNEILKLEIFINVENEKLYYYDLEMGIYRIVEGKKGISLLKCICINYYKDKMRNNLYKDLIESLITEPEIIVKKEDFYNDNVFINFKNGIYNLKDYTIDVNKNNYKNFYFTTSIPVDCIAYNFNNYTEIRTKLNDNIPYFNKYLNTSLDNNPDRERLLFEIIGYCLSNIKPLKKIIILQGLNSSGKSVLLRFITTLLRKYNEQAVCNTSLKQLESRFTNSLLETAKLVCNGELDSSKNLDMSIIKKISGGDDIVVEKKYGDPHVIHPNVKMLFCSNQPLSIEGETTEAMIKRIHTLYFPNEISEKNQNPDLINYILQEKDYIVSIAMVAFREMLQRGKFTDDPNVYELDIQYKKQIKNS